jgi:hypothetical protein
MILVGIHCFQKSPPSNLCLSIIILALEICANNMVVRVTSWATHNAVLLSVTVLCKYVIDFFFFPKYFPLFIYLFIYLL